MLLPPSIFIYFWSPAKIQLVENFFYVFSMLFLLQNFSKMTLGLEKKQSIN